MDHGQPRLSDDAVIRTYYLLTKPGILLGNAITATAGFLLASRGHFDPRLFLITVAGLGCVIASACVFNNYIDRKSDEKMARTKNRALVKGLISIRNALLFAISLGIIGTLILSQTNLLAVAVAATGFFSYVVLYSLLKYHTVYGTLIGSISGAIPPVVGYTAVSHQLDTGAILLFLILVLWQMPHFYSIAIYRFKDYTAASIPVLPIVKGNQITKIHMTLYIIAFIGAALLLTLFGYTGYTYFITAALLGSSWLWTCVQGFKAESDTRWARKMFVVSLVVITALSFMISVDVSIR